MPMVGDWRRADTRLGAAQPATALVTVNIRAHSRRDGASGSPLADSLAHARWCDFCELPRR